MSAPPSGTGAPIESKAQLVEWMAAGSKPRNAWRIGTEHEKFAFTRKDMRPLPYDGTASIRALLEGLAREFAWTPVLENGNPIALVKDRCSITLEPGGQFELSGAPLETLHQTCCETHIRPYSESSYSWGGRLSRGLRSRQACIADRAADVISMPKIP